MANTGFKIYKNLEEFNPVTGEVIQKVPNDPNHPHYDNTKIYDTSFCPLNTTSNSLSLDTVSVTSDQSDLKEKTYGLTFSPSLTETITINFEIEISLRRETTSASNFISYDFSKALDSGFDSSANQSYIERSSGSNMTGTTDYNETIQCSITVLDGESVTFNIYTSSPGTYRNESRAWTTIRFTSSTALNNLPKSVFQTVSSVDGGTL